MTRTITVSTTKTAAAATETFYWAPNEFPGSGLCSVVFKMGSQNAVAPFFDYSKIESLLITADNRKIVDLTRQQIRARFLALTQSRVFFNEGDNAFMYPLTMVGEENQDLAELVQVPRGAQIEIRLACSGLTIGDQVQMATWNSDQKPAFYPEVVRRPLNIQPSTINGIWMIPASQGELRGWAINTSRIKRLNLYMERQLIYQAVGNKNLGKNNEGDMMTAAHADDVGRIQSALPFAASLAPAWIPYRSPFPMLEGRAYFELETDATWTVQDEIALEVLNRQ